MKIAAKTDIGRVREQNQDSYAAGELPGGVAWAVVCDGMGGAAGGNVASSVAVKIISEKITACFHEGMSGHSVKNMLISAVEGTKASLYDMAMSNETLAGMGTTVVACIVTNSSVYIAHAGDSRAYKYTKEGLIQLTKDHSVVQAMVEKGEITQDEAKAHPNKNIITRALGADYEIRADFNEEILEDDDLIILCTDGLTNFVDTEEMNRVINSSHYYELADKLVEQANINGGGDNITVVTLAR